MNEILSFSGQLPEHFDAAFAEIGPELGFARAGQGGLSVALRQGGCLRAEKRADGVVVTWGRTRTGIPRTFTAAPALGGGRFLH